MDPSENAVSIGRWQAEYLIPRGHPAPESLKGRLDDALHRLLRETLDSTLSPLASAAGESIWLIRRLELDLSANTAADMDRATGAWARQIAGKLDRTLQAGADGENVLHFPDWAAYLAYFLGDLVEGLAWGRWFYRAFEGLRPLPVSAAARTAILDDPQAGFHALLSLPAGRLKNLVASLTEADARRVLDGLSIGQQGPVDFTALQEACQRARRFSLTGERLALLVALETGRELGHLAGPELAAAARTAAYPSPHSAGGAQPEDTLSADRPPRRYTPFGGIFLLLPELNRLPLADLLAGFPELDGEDAQAALRLLLLARVGGRSRASRHFNDPVLRDIAGVSPRFTPAAASGWLNRVPRSGWARFNRVLSELDAGNPPAAGLGLVQVPLSGRPAVVVINLLDGAWLSLAGLDPIRQSHWQILRPLLEANSAIRWFGAPELLYPACQLLRLTPPITSDSGSLQEARLDQVAEDLPFLLAPANWRLARPPDLSLALAAQRLIRRFSRGLSGFEQSGLAYFFSNFLDFAVGLDEEPGRRTVFMGRPPLVLVLQRAGWMRQSYHLTWGSECKYELFPEA